MCKQLGFNFDVVGNDKSLNHLTRKIFFSLSGLPRRICIKETLKNAIRNFDSIAKLEYWGEVKENFPFKALKRAQT
jgi:hypothetical protein